MSMAEARGAPDGGLRLLAEDADDLQVISAALQDAVVKVGDITFEPKARRLTIAFNRFCWEAAGEGHGQRRRSALQLGGVLQVKARRIRREPKDAVIELLAVTFTPGEAPGGELLFSFAGDADLSVQVECVDAILADVSRPWRTPHAPSHELG
jgi:hypothetical protein